MQGLKIGQGTFKAILPHIESRVSFESYITMSLNAIFSDAGASEDKGED